MVIVEVPSYIESIQSAMIWSYVFSNKKYQIKKIHAPAKNPSKIQTHYTQVHDTLVTGAAPDDGRVIPERLEPDAL
jgi:hypothetical protein